METSVFLRKLRELIDIELAEDILIFQQKIEALSLSEKQKQGYCWHPVKVIKTGFTYGDRAYIVVERNDTQNHDFRSGNIVKLYTQKDPLNDTVNGTINYLKASQMKIVLNTDHLPLWLDNEKLTLDLLFDERTYKEMQKALSLVAKASNSRLADLRDVLLGDINPSFEQLPAVHIPHLNESQNDAINSILSAEDVALVHGPPGTGKTTTIVEAIKILAQKEGQTLVCAPSNAAVDLLTERLSSVGLNVVRLGNISRVDDAVLNATLDVRLSKHPEFKEIKKLKIKAAQKRREAERFKRNFDSAAYAARKEGYKEARELTAWAHQLEDRLIDQIMSAASVITCTLVGAAGSLLKKYQFHTLFIDEAAQALEPATWIPILKASKVVLAGDPFQLPPTVKSNKAQKQGLSITMMERLLTQIPKVNLLKVQYRMNATIMGFSNAQFYDNQLIADISVEQHQLPIAPHKSVEFIDTAGTGFEEKTDESGKKRENPDEIRLIFEHLHQLIKELPEEEKPTIAIIAPYRAQVKAMEIDFLAEKDLHDYPISINTIDSFQGQERDIVYISLVRSNEHGQIGFLKDYRRMNVAMTRAKKLLVIIGDSATVGQDTFYGDFLDYVDANGSYRTAWEFFV